MTRERSKRAQQAAMFWLALRSPRKKGSKKMGAEWNKFIDSTAIRVTLIVAGLAVWAAAVAVLLSA